MKETNPPRAQFTAELTEAEYVQAALLVARRYGVLSAIPAAMVTGVLLLAAGVALFGFTASPVLPVLSLLLGGLLLLVFLVIEPMGVRRQATRDFAAYARLMQPAETALYADHAETRTPYLMMQDPYALMQCIETPQLFVLVREGEQTLILPKRCLPEQEAEITEFLRVAFVRRRKVMHGWLL